jgi:5,6-dimethylbenzimidazole synthase
MPPEGELPEELCCRALEQVMRRRRDHRHFLPTPLPKEAISDLLEAFRYAPSVGLSQPWGVIVVRSPELRARLRSSFERVRARERERFSGARQERYDQLKLEAITDAPVGLAVYLLPPPGATLGTTSMEEALAYSVVSAITLLWLRATARGLGVGWVSLLDPQEAASLLELPGGSRLIAYLCLGVPARKLDAPLLETLGWERRRALQVRWEGNGAP